MAADEITEKASLPADRPSLQDLAIVILSADRAVLSCSRGVEHLTGYPLQSFDHLNLIEIFEPAESLTEILHRARAGESPASIRMRLRTAADRHLPVEVHCEPLRSSDSSNAQTLLMIREVAPQPERRHPEARSPLLGRLAGTVSHEIRNQMNAIFLHADIVEEELRQAAPDDRTQVTQSLATIKAELTRLHALIQDYLSLARLSDSQPTAVDLRALVEDLVYDMHPQYALRGVALVLSGLDDLGDVALHQASFRRALLNILQLLIDSSPRNATLTLSAGRSSHHIQLQIHDSHKAIPPEVWAGLQGALRGKIPDPADLRTYVAQEIITAHGGEIAVSDGAKAGMLCTITLPLDTMG
jgi:signal transduction histidine kinase